MESKPLASLSASLLARKGTARPAMRRPYIGNSPGATLPVSAQEDLGWDDMGEEHGREKSAPGLKKAVPPLQMAGSKSVGQPRAATPPAVVAQQESLAEKLNHDVAALQISTASTAKGKKPRNPTVSARARKSKAAFTLRLDPARHLRLRLASAMANSSAQQIVTQALDAFLASQPQLEELARQMPVAGGSADGGK